MIAQESMVPPSDNEAEICVLSSLLKLSLAGQTWPREVDGLEINDFYREDHRILFGTMASMYEQGEPIDVVTLKHALVKTEQLETIGGVGYLADMLEAAPSAANLKFYLGIVLENSKKRRAINLGQRLKTTAYDAASSTDKICTLLDSEGAKLKKPIIPESYHLSDSFNELNCHIEALKSGRIQPIPLPWPTLAKSFDGCGIPPKTIGLVSSLTGIGKTWFSFSAALHAAEKGVKTFYLNTEMTPACVASRLLALKVGDSRITSMTNTNHICQAEKEYQAALLNLPLVVTPPETRTLHEVQSLFAAEAQTCQFLILDHLGDLDYADRKPWECLPAFAKTLRDIAQKTGAVVWLVTHIKAGETGEPLAYSRQIENVVDWHFSLTVTGDNCVAQVSTPCGTLATKINRTVAVRKNRYGPSFLRAAMNFDPETLEYKDMGRVKKLGYGKGKFYRA